MGVAGLSVDTDSAERSMESTQRSVESTQRSEDNQAVRIKQYSNKSGTVFGVYGQQPGSNPAQGDTSTNSSGISSPGSSQHGSPARGSNPARGRRRRARSEPRRPRREEKESSPGSDYGSLLSDVETGDSLLLKPGDSLLLKLEESSPIKTGDLSLNKSGDSLLHLTCEYSIESQRLRAKDTSGLQKGDSPDEQTPRQQRRQRQRSASESISDKLSDAQAQRDKDLEDLWPESNSLDRNTSQYGNNAVAVRGAKLQQSDVFQRGCQINATVAVIGNDEFRLTEKIAVVKTGASLIDSNGITEKTAVEPTGGKVHLSGGNRTNCCGSCDRERQASPPPVPHPFRVPVPSHSEHPPHSSTTSTAPAAQCKPKQPDPATSATPLLLPKSRSFILPRSQRPSLTAAPHSCWRLQPCGAPCRTDRRVVQHGWDGAGIPPDDYQEHQRTKSQQQQHTDPRDTQSSHESLLLTGLTKSHNKCNNYSKFEDYNYSSRCHGDGLGTGSVAGLWWTSGGRAAGCHGSSCCLNVVQDVLSRIPVVAPPTRLSSVLDLRTCNTPPAAALLPAEYPLCKARYVSTSTPPVAPHYATMRIKRSSTSLMGNLPCWKQRHHHDDNDVKTKHVSYFNISDVTSTFCSVNVYFSFIQT